MMFKKCMATIDGLKKLGKNIKFVVSGLTTITKTT